MFEITNVMDVATLIAPAFIAGLLTFLAPCTLPLVPAYLGFISGTSATEALRASDTRLRRRIFLNGLAFVLGFSVVFVLLGIFAGYLGHFFPSYQFWLTRIGGAFIMLFGFFMLGVVKLPWLSGEHRLNIRTPFPRGSYLNAFGLGAAFGTGWTPCVGPILGSVLLLATTEGSVGSGAFLLGVFAFGLSVPFLIVAAALGSAERTIERINPYLNWISHVSGALLIILGFFFAIGSMGEVIAFLYHIFSFIHYDGLLNYL